MKKLDLNCDMGELKEGQIRNYDAEIMPYISSCNIACGFHSGSPALIGATIEAAIRENVCIGAHPSYNDWENFGRKSVQVDRAILLMELRYQIAAVKGMAESLGHSLHHVKPHGALYNDMVQDVHLARDVVELVKEIDPKLKIYTLAGSPVVEICRAAGMVPVQEGFADRAYENPHQLRNRAYADAVFKGTDTICARIDDFLAGKLETIHGETGNIQVDTICLHSDTPGAVELGKAIHDHLQKNNVRITAIS